MYPRCTQCDKLFNENGYWDDSITLTRIEAFPYCSDCIKKNGWKKCSSCDKWGDFNNSCSDCNYKKAKENISEEAQRDYEAKKKILAEEMAKVQQQRINEAFSCKGTCGRVISLEEQSYNWKGERYYCQPCIVKKINQELSKNNSSDKSCSECNSRIATGETYYPFPNEPNKIICQTCKNQLELSQAYLDAMKQGIDVTERINKNIILPTHRTNLLSAQKILKREPVNIDNLSLDEGNKQFLRQLQQQNPPKNGLSFDYLNKCKDCGKEEKSVLIGLDCQYCQSRNIETWKNGQLYRSPNNNEQFNNQGEKNKNGILPYIIIPILMILPISSFFFYRWLYRRWKKRKEKN